MKKEDFNTGLNYIDADIVEEYLREKERAQRRIKRHKTAIRLIPLAACFMIMILIVPIISNFITPMAPGIFPNHIFDAIFYPSEYKYVYSFVFYDVSYSARFMNLEQGIEEKYVGDSLGEVVATDKNGKQTICKIYDYYCDPQSNTAPNRRAMNGVYGMYGSYSEILIRGANYKEIIIEIEGKYFPATISPVMVNEK